MNKVLRELGLGRFLISVRVYHAGRGEGSLIKNSGESNCYSKSKTCQEVWRVTRLRAC